MIHLQVNKLTKVYSKRSIFSDLDFEFSQHILGISGANGSGKTTLMKCLCYLLNPTKGEIIWTKNNEVLEKADFKTIIGYSAPYINLYDELSVEENIGFIQNIQDETSNGQSIDEILELTQTTGFNTQAFGSLSSGQQQRAKLAVSLIRDPEILFLDEPGTNLDDKGHQLVHSIVQRARDNGKIVLLASNDSNEIDLCDEVVKL